MNYKDISERIALLTQEIRNVQRMNAARCNGSQRTIRASHEERELRLRQIKEELSKMMLKPTQREQ